MTTEAELKGIEAETGRLVGSIMALLDQSSATHMAAALAVAYVAKELLREAPEQQREAIVSAYSFAFVEGTVGGAVGPGAADADTPEGLAFRASAIAADMFTSLNTRSGRWPQLALVASAILHKMLETSIRADGRDSEEVLQAAAAILADVKCEAKNGELSVFLRERVQA